MNTKDVRITAAHLWAAAGLIGFLPVAWLDHAWLGSVQQSLDPPTRSELARQPWPPLVALHMTGCGFGWFVSTVRSMEREQLTEGGRAQPWGRDGIIATLGRAVRVVFFWVIYGVLVLFGAILLGGSIGEAMRRPDRPVVWHHWPIQEAVLLPYLGVAVYWWRRLLLVLLGKHWGGVASKFSSGEPAQPCGLWDAHLDEE